MRSCGADEPPPAAVAPGEPAPAGGQAKGHTYHRDAVHWTKQAEGAGKALELSPDYAGAQFLEGEASLRLGKPDAARARLEQIVAKDATHVRAFALLAEAYLALNEPELALEHAEHAVELAPNSAEAARVRARVGLEAQDTTAAVEHATRGLALDPLDVDLLLLRGDARAAQGDTAAATEDWRRALELLPAHPRAEAVRARLGE